MFILSFLFKMSNSMKAQVTTLLLGDIEISVFLLPDGTISYGYEILASCIPNDKSILSNKKSPFYLPTLSKGLIAIGKFSQTISVDGISGTYKYLTIEQLMACLKGLEKLGSEKAEAIRDAAMAESLERRALAAFGLKQTIEQANALFKQRVDSKIFRRSFTDALKAYPDLSGEKPNYGRITIYLYQKLGIYKDYLAWKSVEDETKLSFRDLVSPDLLKRILEIEDLAAKLILNRGLEPCAALRQAGEILTYIEPK